MPYARCYLCIYKRTLYMQEVHFISKRIRRHIRLKTESFIDLIAKMAPIHLNHLVLLMVVLIDRESLFCLDYNKPKEFPDHVGDSHKIPESTNNLPNQQIVPPRVLIHSRGGYIKPANNQHETDNFRLSDQISKHRLSDDISTSSGFSSKNPLRNEADLTNSSQIDSRSSRDLLDRNIESSLRQASSDENAFKPSSAVGSEYSLDWLSHSSLAQPTSTIASSDERHSHSLVTTELSSTSISSGTPFKPAQSVYRQQTSAPKDQQLSEPQANHTSTDSELNNQVFYEGPATSPPAGDYYFSSSEKLPNSGRVSNAWW